MKSLVLLGMSMITSFHVQAREGSSSPNTPSQINTAEIGAAVPAILSLDSKLENVCFNQKNYNFNNFTHFQYDPETKKVLKYSKAEANRVRIISTNRTYSSLGNFIQSERICYFNEDSTSSRTTHEYNFMIEKARSIDQLERQKLMNEVQSRQATEAHFNVMQTRGSPFNHSGSLRPIDRGTVPKAVQAQSPN